MSAHIYPQHPDLDADVEELALKHIARSWHSQPVALYRTGEYKKTEQFRRLKAFAVDLLSRRATPQHSVTEQDERAAFEAWARPLSYYLLEMPEKNKRGPARVYYNERTQHAWEGWIGARAQPLASTAATQPEQAVAWMKPDEIEGLIKAASEDVAIRHYGRVYARQYDADMVAVTVLAVPATTAEPGLLAEILSLAEQGMCHGLTADDFCSRIVAKLRAAPASTAAEQPTICAPSCFYGDCPPCVAAGLRPAASEQQAGADERALFKSYAEDNGIPVPGDYSDCNAPGAGWFACFQAGMRAALTHRATTAVDGSIDGQLTGAPFAVKKAADSNTIAEAKRLMELWARTQRAATARMYSRIALMEQFGNSAITAADQQGDTVSECTYLSLQADSFDEWDTHVVEAARGAQRITDLHIRIGDQEWKGSLREVMAALQGAAQAQAGDAPALLRGAVGSVAFVADGLPRVNWMRPERIEAGTLLYVIDRAAMAAPATTGGSNV